MRFWIFGLDFNRDYFFSRSKSRLSVHERQNQRLKTITPTTPIKCDVSQTTEMHSTPAVSNPM